MCVELDIAPTDGTVDGEIQLTREHTEWSGDTHRQTDRQRACSSRLCVHRHGATVQINR